MANDVGRLNGSLETLMQGQRQLGSAIQSVAASQDAARARIEQLQIEFAEFKRQFADFREQDARSKNVQQAQAAIITVRQQIDTEFGHYADVRRHATGILQGMDARIVAHDTIRQVTEEIMLATPRYWLSPALVGLASWIRDDQALAERGLGESLRRHNDKTSLFFALILRRHQRDEAALRWLRQYMARQNPKELGRESIIILDATATGGFGPAARSLILEHADRWHEQLSEDAETVERQVQRWTEFVDSHRRPIRDTFEILPTASPTWPDLVTGYESATAFNGVLSFVRPIFDKPVDVDRKLPERMDDLLNALVDEFDSDETPLRRQEAELEAVIRYRGDTDAAAQYSKAVESAFDLRTDLFTLLSNAAMAPEQTGVSSVTQRLAAAMAREWIESAARRHEAAAIAAEPATVKLSIEGWEATVDQDTSEGDLVSDLGAHVDRGVGRELAGVKFAGTMLGAAIAAAAASAIAIYSLAVGNGTIAVYFLVGALAAGIWSFFESRQIPRHKEAIAGRGRARKEEATATLRGALAELVDLREQIRTERAAVDDLVAFAQALQPGAHAQLAPDARREALLPDTSVKTTPFSTEQASAAAGSDRVLAIKLPEWDLVPPTELISRPGR